jgi:hypothetical protein
MATDLRCSSWTRSQGVDPIGTAGCYSGFLLVECPLPWPRDAAELPGLGEVATAAKRLGVRLQALVPQSRTSERRVIAYRWDADRGRFVGFEAPAGEDPAATALAFLAGEQPPSSRSVSVTDLLICGHGRRDRCCGSLGTSLFEAMRVPQGVRIWRTSHTGGHRFAPTAIVLPHGTCWGYLDAPSLSAIIERSGPASEHLSQYRGCTGLASPAVQAVERAVLGELDWQLLDARRSGEERAGEVTFSVATERGWRTWQAKVAVARTLPVPSCGAPPSDADKTEDELVVTDLEERPADRGADPG